MSDAEVAAATTPEAPQNAWALVEALRDAGTCRNGVSILAL